MPDTTESLQMVLVDSDDLIEAMRKDEVYYIVWDEVRRLLLAKHDALATALARLEAAEAENLRLHAEITMLVEHGPDALAPKPEGQEE